MPPKDMEEAMDDENLYKVVEILETAKNQLHGLMGDEFEVVTLIHQTHEKGKCGGIGIVTKMTDVLSVVGMLIGALSALEQAPTSVHADRTVH